MNKDDPFFIKELVIKSIRNFFYDQDFHEVVVPVLNKALPLEPNLYAFKTDWQYMDKTEIRYLPTSPEAALKKKLAQGLEKVFAIGHSFRNLEPADLEHNPEFLMLEWYRSDANYQQIMDDVEQLVAFLWQEVSDYLGKSGNLEYQGERLNLSSPWKRLSLEKLFEQAVGISLKNCLGLDEIKTVAKKLNYQIQGANWEQLFNQIFMDQIEPMLGKQPLFLVDFPSQISPLCKTVPNKPYLAERFEVYLGGLEIGNGNNEQTDATLVEEAFLLEQKQRQKNQLPVHPIDNDFLEALQKMHSTKKQYAGIGVGLERVEMILSNLQTLN